MITSKSNPKIKEVRLLKQAKHRQARGEYFIEGVRLAEEALGSAQPVRLIVHSPRLEKITRGAALLSLGKKKCPSGEWFYVSDEIMDSLSDTETHQGILAVLKKREYRWEDLRKRPGLILLLHELQDPGNLGTIFRVAEAGMASGLVLTRGTLDPYNPKAVRASMGSIFRLPFLSDQDSREALETLRSLGYRIYSTSAGAGTALWEADFSRPAAVLFGQEGAGLPPELVEQADERLTIPMNPAVNSLNVAISAGIILFEALRQDTVRNL
ncbi:MAG: RNA methyltransferase [Syntrophaceae bacterium]|nr:RNA methyltransferase [Syntrophaceae bacterium]